MTDQGMMKEGTTIVRDGSWGIRAGYAAVSFSFSSSASVMVMHVLLKIAFFPIKWVWEPMTEQFQRDEVLRRDWKWEFEREEMSFR